MPAKKKTPPPAPPITVADLLLALATFPQDAVLTTNDEHIDVGVLIDNGEDHPEYVMLIDWHHSEALRYRRPDIVREIVHRNSPGDDFATAQEFLEWLGKSDMVLRRPGHGHNELDGPVMKSGIEIAEEFARRSESS
ncbi:hypothetical protein SEA_FUZZBUSTER_68 [Microbacterium phage FuzzBuster]|uniref:Uncharacterized protein n=1 Tax=Microbacterium phage FuzzBuster TaxID=2590935 RepID=A0A516KV47_9CAUD|nr:hypothetical protein SEA_FUZZBUSTER_68 [Microbacterium phage FuzzBuster]